MPKTHPPDVRLRAVALAEAKGIPAAARQLGIDERTLAGWIAEAPDQSALERAHDLAMSEMTSKMASGETRGIRDLAVVAGIMRDKIARYGKDKAEPAGPSALEVREALSDWMTNTLVDESDLANEASVEAVHVAIDGLESELLRRANDEPEQTHRPTILAWHSGREVTAAPDFMDWATAHLSQLVMEHGDLITAATEARRLDEERHRFDYEAHAVRAARVRMYVESGMSTFEAVERASQPVELDPDTLALLERAEAELQESPQ